MALCSAHPDRHRSLSIAEGKKGVLIRCMSMGCDTRDVLRAAGLTMEALLQANAQPVSREAISMLALRRKLHDDDRSVDQLVMKLRRKLGEIGCGERVILSVRRQGYVISTPSLFQLNSEASPA